MPVGLTGEVVIKTAEPLAFHELGQPVGSDNEQTRLTLGHKVVVADESFGVLAR